MSNIGKSEESSSRNTVYIGRQKPVMNYVLAALTCLNNSPNVILKARGAAISLAVDVAEITVKRFGSGVRVAGVKIDTEQMASQEGGSRNVSTIEIELTTRPTSQEVTEGPTPSKP
jgi:DNA-binding protein